MPSTTHGPTSLPTATGLRPSGKWLVNSLGERVLWNGVTYGPFPPNSNQEPWPENERLHQDFQLLKELNVNVLRIYEMPNQALLEQAKQHDIGLLVTIPWSQHIDFLESSNEERSTLKHIVSLALQVKDYDHVWGILVGNEIEAGLVRWMGPEKVREFLEQVIDAVKRATPQKLVSYTTYPSTEYLIPRNADFVAFNLFLETPEALSGYLQRLQVLAEGRPLIITEFGLDSQRNGEGKQAECREWSNAAFRHAEVAGSFWFSFTDEWYRGGKLVTDWAFGLVDLHRVPKKAFHIPPIGRPRIKSNELRISVVVCTRNGSATLRGCLEALSAQVYPNFEVWIIDDGSTEPIESIAKDFPTFHYRRQEHAGLSVARNLGMELSNGDIIAYTDDDCMPDPNWLVHIAAAYDSPEWVAAGGPNLPPPPRNAVEACVALAPGAPAHVLVNDTEAEHLPGCNLTVRKSALQAIGGFRPQFMAAGDDVDLGWRLQQAGGKLRFVPSAVVWHHRRLSIRSYYKQQRGYGHAESMLIRDYPERFAWFSGAHWRGIIYGDEFIHAPLSLQHIHFGELGAAPFQCIYSGTSMGSSSLFVGLPWVIFCLLLTLIATFSGYLAFYSLALASWLGWALAVHYRYHQVYKENTSLNVSHRALLLLLQITQPLVRDYARTKGLIQFGCKPMSKIPWGLIFSHWKNKGFTFKHPTSFKFWSENHTERIWLIQKMIEKASASPLQVCVTSAWETSDLRVSAFGITREVHTVSEYHGDGKILTKLRLGQKIHYWPLVVLLLLLSLSTFLPWRVSVWTLGLALLSLIYFWKVIRFHRNFQRLLDDAVKDTDLQQVS